MSPWKQNSNSLKSSQAPGIDAGSAHTPTALHACSCATGLFLFMQVLRVVHQSGRPGAMSGPRKAAALWAPQPAKIKRSSSTEGLQCLRGWA